VTPRGLGPRLPQLEAALRGQSGAETVVVIPIVDAGADETDLVVIGVDPDRGTSRSALFRGDTPFGASTELDLGFKAGRLVMRRNERGFLTAWTPTGGAPQTLLRGPAAVPEGVLPQR
jgi:hypothetical protein